MSRTEIAMHQTSVVSGRDWPGCPPIWVWDVPGFSCACGTLRELLSKKISAHFPLPNFITDAHLIMYTALRALNLAHRGEEWMCRLAMGSIGRWWPSLLVIATLARSQRIALVEGHATNQNRLRFFCGFASPVCLVKLGAHQGGHATTCFLEGFVEGSLKEVLLRRVLGRCLVKV